MAENPCDIDFSKLLRLYESAIRSEDPKIAQRAGEAVRNLASARVEVALLGQALGAGNV